MNNMKHVKEKIKKTEKSSNRTYIVIMICIFLAGAILLLYPFVSSIVNSMQDVQIIDDYNMQITNLPRDVVEDELNRAKEYNSGLGADMVLTDPFDPELLKNFNDTDYLKILNLDGSGVMGYVDYPDLGIYLPIYHTTSDEALSKGAGHLENTSLPVGGKGTHSVISAHTAFGNEVLFDNLIKAKQSDLFYIHVLDKVLVYRVDQIKVVTPDNTSDLRIVNDKDYVTLLTCTPYSVNSHRLLVRGERINQYDENEVISTPSNRISNSRNGGLYFYGLYVSQLALIIIVLIIIVLVVLCLFFVLRNIKKKRN